MKRYIGLGLILAVNLVVFGCSTTDQNKNANIRGTNTNTGYVAPANASTPMMSSTPLTTMTPMMNSNMKPMMNSNMKPGNMNSKMNSNMGKKSSGNY